MGNPAPFAEVLEAASNLTLEDQQALADILRRRVSELRRAELARDIQEAQREFDTSACRPVAPHELMKDILA